MVIDVWYAWLFYKLMIYYWTPSVHPCLLIWSKFKLCGAPYEYDYGPKIKTLHGRFLNKNFELWFLDSWTSISYQIFFLTRLNIIVKMLKIYF